MTKFIATALLSIFYINVQAQSCNCELLIDPAYFSKVNLYKHPGSTIQNVVKNDSLKEDYLLVLVDADSAGYFHATLTYQMSGKSFTGWVKKEKYLGTYSRNYNPKVRMPVYADANKKSKVTRVATRVTFCPVTKCKQKWVYTTLPGNISGWLPPDMQCANAYTTCN